MRRGLGGSKAEIVRAAALWRLGRRDEAIAAGEEAAPHHPDDVQIQQALSQHYLGTGDFARGWADYEFRAGTFDRKQAGDRDAGAALDRRGRLPARPSWSSPNRASATPSSSPASSSILHERGAKVKALVQPALLGLPGRCPRRSNGSTGSAQVGALRLQIPLLSLPRVLGTGIDSIPATVPYLAPDAAAVAAWRTGSAMRASASASSGRAIRATATTATARCRCKFFAPLARLPGVRLISLQAVHGLDQLATLPEGMAVETLGDRITANPEGVSEIAAAMAALDLVVSSDTAMAHLAGALGVRVWLALGDDPDWRWMLERADSPWYPTMRLFRQKARGDWAGVFAEMAAALGERTPA